MLSLPKQTSIAYKIITLLHKNGPHECGDIVDAMIIFGHTKCAIKSAMRDLRANLHVTNDDGKYDLARPVRKHMDDISAGEPGSKYKGEIVPPRTAPEFRPIQPKNQFWNALRREPIRTDVGFKTGGTGHVPFDYRY